MKLEIFDVVELGNRNKAIILQEISKDKYKAEVVNNKGETQGIAKIGEKDVINVIFSKQDKIKN